MSPGLMGKRLAVLKEMAPHIRRVAVLVNPDNPAGGFQLKEAQAAAAQLSLKLQPIPIKRPQDIERLLPLHAGRVDATIVTDDPVMDDFRTPIGTFAIQNRLPSICSYRMPEDKTCLIWYGPDLLGMYKRAGSCVVRILNGAKPADLPVEQPARLTLVINTKQRVTSGSRFRSPYYFLLTKSSASPLAKRLGSHRERGQPSLARMHQQTPISQVFAPLWSVNARHGGPDPVLLHYPAVLVQLPLPEAGNLSKNLYYGARERSA